MGVSETEFDSLKESWQVLFHSNPNHTPFQSWEWNYAWWKHFGSPGRLRLLILEEEGRLIGLAPLCLETRYRGAPLRHLAFIACKRADYLDFLVAAGREGAFFTELFAFLAKRTDDWRFLDIRDFPECSTNLPHLLREGLRAFPFMNLQISENCASVHLPATWDGYLATLGKNGRRNAVRYRRHLAENFKMRWEAPTAPPDIRRYFEDFATLFRERWGPEQGATFFDLPQAAAFERELCVLGSEAGWYRLYLVYADDHPVAGYLGFVCNNRFYTALLAHSPMPGNQSPGTVLIGMTIEDCIGNSWTELDMTRGDEPYKFQWNAVLKRNYRIKLSCRRSLLAYSSAIDWLRKRLESVSSLHRLRAAYRRRFARTAPAQGGRPGRSASAEHR